MKFLLLLLIAGSPALACNNLRMDRLDDVDLTSNPAPAEAFRVRKSGNPTCSYFLTVDNGGASSYATRKITRSGGSETIPVQICRDAACSTIMKHFPEVTSSADVISGTFAATPRNHDVTIYPRLGTLDYQRFGSFSEDFTVRLYEGTVGGSHTLRDTQSFEIRYSMSRKIDLSIVSTGLPFDPSSTSKTLNFGVLSAGVQQGFDLVLKYNAGYRVKFSSQNNGSLKHSTAASTVPYSLVFGGAPVTLAGSASNPVTVTQGTGSSPAAGLRFSGNFTIGTIGNGVQPGNYSDAITVTVTTTE